MKLTGLATGLIILSVNSAVFAAKDHLDCSVIEETMDEYLVNYSELDKLAVEAILEKNMMLVWSSYARARENSLLLFSG